MEEREFIDLTGPEYEDLTGSEEPKRFRDLVPAVTNALVDLTVMSFKASVWILDQYSDQNRIYLNELIDIYTDKLKKEVDRIDDVLNIVPGPSIPNETFTDLVENLKTALSEFWQSLYDYNWFMRKRENDEGIHRAAAQAKKHMRAVYQGIESFLPSIRHGQWSRVLNAYWNSLMDFITFYPKTLFFKKKKGLEKDLFGKFDDPSIAYMFGVTEYRRVAKQALRMGMFLDNVFFDSQHRFATSKNIPNKPEEAFRLIL
jgi:uncharacterized protein (DUF924 family)